ncbi:MAG: Transcriptional regulator LuxR family [Hyphomonadaceae bacterium]|nr:MAG: Transcriptional regulator LuxR family [Hyphomonadaceae bacterium]KAF0185903.1 MAG: Transcriptional regulator LuxR family [Hyphomonadaceae bacterium]
MPEYFYPIASLTDFADNMPAPKPSTSQIDPILADIMAELYQCALGNNDDKWHHALARLRAEFRGTGVDFYCVNFANKGFEIYLTEGDGCTASDISVFEDLIVNRMKKVLALSFPKCALASNLHYSKKFMERRISSDGFPMHSAHFLALIRPEEPFWDVIGIMRPYDGEPFTYEDCERFGSIYDDLRRIGTIIHTRAAIARDPTQNHKALENLDGPFGIANGVGKMLSLNSHAKKLLAQNGTYPFHGEAWENCARQAVRLGSATFETAFATIKLKPIDRHENNQNLRLFNYGRTNLLLVFEEISRGLEGEPNLIANRYGLSQAEAEILFEVRAGNAPSQIAQKRGNSVATVRTQLRSIRKKTGAKSQLELATMS